MTPDARVWSTVEVKVQRVPQEGGFSVPCIRLARRAW
jgi:hypothetical protein